MNWRRVRNFGDVKYFNISYAVLLIVPLMANTFEMLKENNIIHLSVPVTVKSLYYASICYTIAIAIYQLKCPEIIREYSNVQAYIENNLKIFLNKAPYWKYYIVLAHLDRKSEDYEKITSLNLKIKQATTEIDKSIFESELDAKLNLVYPSSIQAHLERKYDEENKQKKSWCWTAALFYWVGSGIILYLLIYRTIIVFNS